MTFLHMRRYVFSLTVSFYLLLLLHFLFKTSDIFACHFIKLQVADQFYGILHKHCEKVQVYHLLIPGSFFFENPVDICPITHP
jgi:hypothetical protein